MSELSEEQRICTKAQYCLDEIELEEPLMKIKILLKAIEMVFKHEMSREEHLKK